MKKLLAVLSVSLLAACSSHNDAKRALTAAGYTEIQTHGHSFFGCSKEDTFATKFTAKNPKGEKIEGVVCSSWLKGATIRF